MDNTHEKVEKIVREKALDEMKKLANDNIETFIKACHLSGFKSGLKVGFWVGILVALIIYFVIN